MTERSRRSRRRRTSGEGTLIKVTDKQGRTYYRGSVSAGWENGRRVRYEVKRAGQADAVAAMQDIRDKLRRGQPRAATRPLTLGAYLADWQTRHANAVKESTQVRYRQFAAMLPRSLTDKPLPSLTAADLERLYGRLLTTHAPNTVLHLHRFLHVGLRRAEREGLVTRNVAALADSPRVPHRETETVTPEQARAMLRAAKGDRYEALYVLAIASGMREGELLALRWQDIDWDAGAVHIRAGVRRGADGLQRRETKTGRQHVVSVPPVVLAALKSHRIRQAEERLLAGELWKDGDIVFARPDGRLTQEFTFLQSSWYKVRRRVDGLATMTFHAATRHGAASLLIAAGVPLKVVQDILGHSSIVITADRYTHLYAGSQDDAVAAMESVLGGL